MEYSVVQSIKGRDAGRWMIVLEDADGYVRIADGKERPLERPKRKNKKHVRFCRMSICIQNLSNTSLRKALRCLSKEKEDIRLCPKKT